RTPAVVAVVALLVAGGVADRAHRAGASREAAAFSMPIAAPSGALSSAWYCAGGTAAPGGQADGTLIVANPSSRRVHATVTFTGSDAGVEPVHVPVTLRPRSRVGLDYRHYIQSTYAAVVV